MKKAVVLISGGLDSSTVLAMVSKLDYQIYAISFNYLQRHSVELSVVKQFLKDYRVIQHKIINIDLRTFGGSALTDKTITVPKHGNINELNDDVPITYVPARNTIFLSYALAFSEVIGAYDIFIGVHATDYSNYPDCREEYIKSFEIMANLATNVKSKNKKIAIHAPLINMTKGQIIATGLKLCIDYSKTLSCYDPTHGGLSCGKCDACLIRLKGFSENGVADPIHYI